MIDNEDDQRLKSLENRLKAARSQEDAEDEDVQPPTAMGAAFRLGIELVVGVVVGALIGYQIDVWFETGPFGLLIMLVLGFVAGVRNVYREAARMQEEADKEDP